MAPRPLSKTRVTAGIAIAAILAWLLLRLSGFELWVFANASFIPASLSGGVGQAVPFWLTPLTATLLHANALHVAFNMMMLFVCGRAVEAALGPLSLALIYLLGAYGAAAAQFAVDPGSTVPMIGASGAVASVLGAYAMLFGRNKVKVGNARLALWLNALWLMVTWVWLNLAAGYVFATITAGEMQIAAAAHVGGFLVGLVLVYPLLLFRYRKA